MASKGSESNKRRVCSRMTPLKENVGIEKGEKKQLHIPRPLSHIHFSIETSSTHSGSSALGLGPLEFARNKSRSLLRSTDMPGILSDLAPFYQRCSMLMDP